MSNPKQTIPGFENLPDIAEIESKIKSASSDIKDTPDTKKGKSDIMQLKELDQNLSMLKNDYIIKYKELVSLLESDVTEINTQWGCKRQSDGTYDVQCGGKSAVNNAKRPMDEKKFKGKFFSWSNIKNNILRIPGDVSWQQCKNMCDKDDECSAWEKCTPGTGCSGCYLVKDYHEEPVNSKSTNYAETKPRFGTKPAKMTSIRHNSNLRKIYGPQNSDGSGRGGFGYRGVYYDSKKLSWRQQSECKQACLDDPECEIAHHFYSNATCYLGKKEAVADQSKWRCHWDQNGCRGKNYGFHIKQGLPALTIETNRSATGSYASSGWGGPYTDTGTARHNRPVYENEKCRIHYEKGGDWGSRNMMGGQPGWTMYAKAGHHRMAIVDTRPYSIFPPFDQEWISRGGRLVNQGDTFIARKVDASKPAVVYASGNSKSDCEFITNESIGYVKQNNLKCKDDINDWRKIVDMNYAADLIEQGKDKNGWIYLSKHDSAEACKRSAQKKSQTSDNSFNSVVYFDSDYNKTAFQRDCYGQLSDAQVASKSEQNVTTMIPPNGTTTFGGKDAENKLKSLQGLNIMMEELMVKQNGLISGLYKDGLYTEEKVKKAKEDFGNDMFEIKKQRKVVQKILSEHFGNTAKYLDSIKDLKKNKYTFIGFFLLAIIGAFITFRIMKSQGPVKIPKGIAKPIQLKPMTGGAKRIFSKFFK